MKTKWKVVALRNGAAEAMVIEADFAEIMEAGVLMLMNSGEAGRLETVHAFAPGHWTEVSPAEPKPRLEKRNGFCTFTVTKMEPAKGLPQVRCVKCGSTEGHSRVHHASQGAFCPACFGTGPT